MVPGQSHDIPGSLNFFSRWINCSQSQEIIWVCARVWDPRVPTDLFVYPNTHLLQELRHSLASPSILAVPTRCGEMWPWPEAGSRINHDPFQRI